MDDQQADPERAHFLAVAVGAYHDKRLERLGEVVPVTRKLAQLLCRAGFVHNHPELVGEEVCVGTIDAAIKEWFVGHRSGDRAVVYWTGHGFLTEFGEHVLAGTDTPHRPTEDDAINPSLLFKRLIRSSAQVSLLIIDTCFSGMAGVNATDLMSKLRSRVVPSPTTVDRRIGVLTTSHPARTVTSPVFGAALVKVLANPESGKADWGRHNEWIGLGALQEALEAEIGFGADVHIDWVAWKARRSGWANDDGRDWLPNPAWVGQGPDEVVEVQRELEKITEAGKHWDLSHRGLEIGASGWAFVGREVTLQKIVHWLESSRQGMLVVTGPPGSGKSAVIGRLVTLSVKGYRERAASAGILVGVTLPREGAFDAAVHAKGKRLIDVVSQLATAFGLDRGEQTGIDLQTMKERLRSHLLRLGQEGRVCTIAIDAVDEALEGHKDSIVRICRELGQIMGVRVLVGVRYSVSGDPVPQNADRQTRLNEAWPEAIIVDLADDPNSRADLTRYVADRLAKRHGDENVGSVAEAVADRALTGGGLFLYARIIARTLEEAKALPKPGDLPPDATAAFAEDLLVRFGGDERVRFDDLLGALAWGFGSGFPKTVWAHAASAISAEGAVYGTEHVNEVLRRAGWHIIESAEDGQSVYRLGHELLNEYYRNAHQGREVEVGIALAICDAVAAGGWGEAPPYAVRHLLSHFHRGVGTRLQRSDAIGRIVAFCLDPLWVQRAVHLVGVAGAVNLLDHAYTLTGVEDLKVLARVLRRGRVAISRDARQLAAQLHARLADTGSPFLRKLLDQLSLNPSGYWLRSRGKLLSWQADRETNYTIGGKVRSLAFAEVEGTTYLAIGVDDRVILWDSLHGAGKEWTVHNPGGRVTALSIERMGEDPVLVIAATYDQNISIRHFRTGEQIGPTYATRDFVDSVAVGWVRGRRLVAGCGESRLQIWDQQSGAALDENDFAKPEETWRIAGVLTVGGRIALSLSRSRSPVPSVTGFDTMLVDLDSGQALWPSRFVQGEPKALAMSVLPRGPVGAAVLTFGPPRLSATAWSPASTVAHQVVGQALIGLGDATVRALAVGELDGRVVVAYAPDFDGGSGFVKLVEMGGDPAVIWEGYELEPELLGHNPVYLSNLDIWSVVPGNSNAVRVLVSRPSLSFLEVRSGSNWGSPVVECTPEMVSRALEASRDVVASKSVEAAFSILDAGAAIPIRIDQVEAANQKCSSSSELLLRKKDPASWPATAVSRGFLDGRAVLVCGSYQGVIWIWDLASQKVVAGPFADIPDEMRFPLRAKMAASRKSVTTDVALGEVGGRDVVAAAVAGRAKLYDAKTGTTLPAPAASVVVAVALGNVRGRSVLVTGTLGGVLAVWEADTGKRIAAVTLDSEITGVWVIHGVDSVAARDKAGRLLVFDLVGG